MIRLISFIVFLACAFSTFAQEFKVTRITSAPDDKMSSQISRTDMNGNKCALLIITLDCPGAKFYGNTIGESSREKGDYLVYMSPGSKKLQIQHNLASPLRLNFADYGFDQLESGKTYRITIDVPNEIRNAALAGVGADTKTPKHLSLFCKKDGQNFFFTKKDWNELSHKESYKKMGLVIIDREEQFFISLEEYGEYTKEEIQKYLPLLPTEGEVQAIIDDLGNVQDALEFFGAEKLSMDIPGYYMTSKYENNLILGDTSFSWDFARDIHMISSQNKVRPTSNNFDNISENPFNLPASVIPIRSAIMEARYQKDYPKELELCISIQEEDSYAQFFLGEMYQYAQGVDQDYPEAIKWYKKSAEKDNDYAQTSLGFLYLNGEGVEMDLEEASIWLTKGAENGNSNAQNALGWMYENGKGFEVDYEKAKEWYLEAAENDHENAQINLGLIYYNGKGCDVDYQEAFNWWYKAAEQGNPTAQCNVGFLYQKGYGVEQDLAKAKEMYEKSAEQGNAQAQNNLGSLYESGIGVVKDLSKAKDWYEKAAAQGHEEARESLKKLNPAIENSENLGRNENEQESIKNTVDSSKGTINGYEYVDLGLPSGLKWATCNVGTSSPEQYGSYFAWGETITKSEYTKKNSETYKKNKKWLNKNGYIGSDGSLTLSHDAARQNWGGTWRMPTHMEIVELTSKNNTTSEETTLNGVKGMLITSKKNGNSIFLPYVGCHDGSSLGYAGKSLYYWTSTPNLNGSDTSSSINHMTFKNQPLELLYDRYLGFAVRPVSE